MKEVKRPNPPKRAHSTTNHGHTLVDDYHWLRERDNSEVIAHLEEENRYYEYITRSTQELCQQLSAEMISRMKEEEESLPARYGQNWYSARTVKDEQYLEHYRREGSAQAEAKLIIDCNELARELEYFDLGVFTLSLDQRLLAYAVDSEGNESYELYIKDLDSGELLADRLSDISSAEWTADNKTILYTVRNQALRTYKVMQHRLGTAQAEDVEIYVEKDERFSVDVERSKNDKYMMISCESQTTTEYLIALAGAERLEFKVFFPRCHNTEYHVIPHVDSFYVLTNADGAYNFKLMEVSEQDISEDKAVEVVAHDPESKLEDVDEHRNYLVLTLRERGLNRIKIMRLDEEQSVYIDFPEACYSIETVDNPNFDDHLLYYLYTSLTRLATTYEYDMQLNTQRVARVAELAVPYDHRRYASERLYAKAVDGVEIPVSIVYRKDFRPDGQAPLMLYGYGAYGISLDAAFSANRISLLERGFAVALAHVRGGSDMGEQWYLSGKLDQKKNTFTDFIACAEMLVSERYTSSERLGIIGGSAGGLLVGAVLNLRPSLFGAAIADVPFVDLMNTMCDPSLPLTIGEYEEWGNPTEDAEAYNYMLSYSPYDNIRPAAYPAVMAIAGFNDPRVSYWEPAKWILKLREYNASDKPIVLKVNMEFGHSGASGRYNHLHELAAEYAFLISTLLK